jgi:hypothetical protein
MCSLLQSLRKNYKLVESLMFEYFKDLTINNFIKTSNIAVINFIFKSIKLIKIILFYNKNKLLILCIRI